MEQKISIIKILFLLISGVLAVIMWIGVHYLKENAQFSGTAITNSARSIWYRTDFLLQENSNNAFALALEPFRGAAVSFDSERQGNAVSIPVLVYHGILDGDSDSHINISKARFKEQLFALKRAGYTTITTDELYRYMRGEITLPKRSFMITFDDGRIDSFENGDPVLQALDFEAVMFILTKYSVSDMRSNYYVSPPTIRFMEKSGRWDIQSHSEAGHEFQYISQSNKSGHFFSSALWLENQKRNETKKEFSDRISADFALSQEKLETLLDKEIRSFAFPFGDFGQYTTNLTNTTDTVLTSAKRYYDLLFYQNRPGLYFHENTYTEKHRDDGKYLIRRIIVDGEWTGEELLKTLEQTGAKELPYFDNFTENHGWVNAWGHFEIGSGSMTIRPKPHQTGSAAILDGSRAWRDYYLRADVVVPEQNNIYVWVRFQDDKNNAGCNFGEGFAHVEQHFEGKKRVIKGYRDENFTLPEGEFEVGVRVSGRTVTCYIDGEAIVRSDFLNASLDQGGIGIKTWDEDPGFTEASVKRISVEPL